MPLQAGDKVIPFTLKDYRGAPWRLDSVAGRPYLLAFFRFASCPFCNLRLHTLVQRMGELPQDFTIVAVFDASLPELRRYAGRHHPPFPVLADEGAHVHDLYQVEYSWLGVAAGMVKRFPTLLHAMFGKGFWPKTVEGRLNTMPADLLVDRKGVICRAFYGRDEGDHLPIEEVVAFARDQCGIA